MFPTAGSDYDHLVIPQDKLDAVTRGVGEAFGSSSARIDEICRISREGNSRSPELAFRIVVQGRPALLRVFARTDERHDPVRVFACMEEAAAAGVAPRVLYSHAGDGVAILEWIEGVPFSERRFEELGRALRRLHDLPADAFPKSFNWVTPHRFFIWKLQREQSDAEVFRRYEQICAVYPRDEADLTPCHMDVKPENIVFDGQRVWLTDWTAAFINDRYFDLAVAASFVGGERSLLEAYWGRPAEENELARFFLMQQVLHMLTAAVYLVIGIDEAIGRDHWERLRRNVADPRFDEALRVVASRRPGPAGLLLPIGG